MWNMNMQDILFSYLVTDQSVDTTTDTRADGEVLLMTVVTITKTGKYVIHGIWYLPCYFRGNKKKNIA